MLTAAQIKRLLTADQIRDAQRARAVRSLSSFVKQAWQVLEPGRPLIWSWHMDLICTKLEAAFRGEITELVINIPPRHSKSTLVAVCWPAWIWLQDPTRRFYNISGLDKVAKRDSRAMRKVCNSKWYKALQAYMKATNNPLYKEWCWEKDQNEKINFENSLGGYRKCTTINGSILGDGADILIIDDPYDVKDVMGSIEQVNRRMDWSVEVYDDVLESRLNDPKTGVRVIIMQRLHENDIPGYLLGKYVENGACNREGFDYVVLPTQYDPDHPYVSPDDPRTQPGELLNRERYDEEWVKERANDPKRSQAWASQHQQLPRPKEGTKFQLQNFNNRYDLPPWVYARQMEEIVISIDAAEKKGKDNDFSSILVEGKLGSKIALLDRVNAQMEITELLQASLLMFKKWPLARAKLIEDKSNGTALIQLLKKPPYNITGIVPVNPGAVGGKEVRAKFSQVRYEANDMELPQDQYAPWVQDFIDQHLSFPRGKNDDDIDAESQAVYYFEEGVDPSEEYARLLNAFAG